MATKTPDPVAPKRRAGAPIGVHTPARVRAEAAQRRKPTPGEAEQIRTCLWNLRCEMVDLPDLIVLPEEAERLLRCAMADVAEATRLCRLSMPEAWRP